VGMKEMVSLLVKIVLLILAALAIIFGFFWDSVNSQSQRIEFDSAGKGMPDDGFYTPMYDPWTTVRVEVSADEEVEVQLYASHYRGGKLSKDAGNNTVYRDEWLAAGEESERTGTSVELKDFSRTSAYYWVKVLQPGTSIPSDSDYTIKIKAKTIDMSLIGVGVLLYALFLMWGVLETSNGIFAMLKTGVPVKGEAQAAGLEALLEPTAPAAAAPAPTAYESLYGAPAPRQAPPAAPPPRAPEPPQYAAPQPVYQPPPAPPAPPAYQPQPQPAAPAYPAQAYPAQAYQQAPAYQAPPAPPAYAPPAYAAPPPPPAAPPAREPVSKVRCPACKSIVPIYTTERPTPIECPVCGKKGMIR